MEGQNDSNITTVEVDENAKQLPAENASESQKKLMEHNPQQFTEKDKLDYVAFMSNPANISKATQMAFELVEVVGKNWFSLARLCSKSKLSKETAFMKLSLLIQFGMLVHKEEKMKVGKSWEKVTVYKVVVSNEAKIEEFRLAIEYYKVEISKLEMQIVDLQQKLE